MNVSCPECQSVFRVDPARVPGPGIRARCSVCGGIIPITSARSWTDDFAISHDAASLTAAPARAGASATGAAGLADRPIAAEGSRVPSGASQALGTGGAASVTPPAGVPRSATPTRIPPFAPGRRPTPAGLPTMPSAAAPQHHPHLAETKSAPPASSGQGSTPQAAMAPPMSPPARASGPPAAPLAPQVPSMQPPRPVVPSRDDIGQATRPSGAPSPDMRTSDVPIGAPAARSVAPIPPSAASATPFPMPRAASPMADSPTVQSARADATAATPPKSPINPFLANDPNQKAKRLARALVSDMVAYHPQKRDEGMRAGTLKQLFREEIKKSYEEYVDQIGKEFAETTSHFQDALNDVLAGGKKVF